MGDSLAVWVLDKGGTMSWGTSGGQTHRCRYCESEWWEKFTAWYYDPKEGKVTSEHRVKDRPEWHDTDCSQFDGTTLEDAIRMEKGEKRV